MSTLCFYCTKNKEYNCDNCGNPICKEHSRYREWYIFCGMNCIKEWEQGLKIENSN